MTAIVVKVIRGSVHHSSSTAEEGFVVVGCGAAAENPGACEKFLPTIQPPVDTKLQMTY